MRMIQIDEEKQTLCSTGSHQASNPSNRQQTDDCGRLKSVQQVLFIVVIINTFLGQDQHFSSSPVTIEAQSLSNVVMRPCFTRRSLGTMIRTSSH